MVGSPGDGIKGVFSEDMIKMAGFVVVTLIVGLIGLAVVAQFDPIEPPPTVPLSTTASTLANSFTTSTSRETPTSETGPASTSAVAPTDALIELDQNQLNFGDNDTTRSLQLTNSGGTTSTWDITSTDPALVVSPNTGDLDPGASVVVEVTLDRATAPEGDLVESLEVTWPGGTLTTEVVAANNVSPVIHNPEASPAALVQNASAACSPTQATVSVRVRDASALSSVVLRWGGQETAMIDAGNEMWEGVIGPYAAVGTETVRVVAFDEHGNAGGAAITVEVLACT